MSGSGTCTTSNSCDPSEEDDDVGDDISRGLGQRVEVIYVF